MNYCQHCQKNAATVHVTELLEPTESPSAGEKKSVSGSPAENPFGIGPLGSPSCSLPITPDSEGSSAAQGGMLGTPGAGMLPDSASAHALPGTVGSAAPAGGSGTEEAETPPPEGSGAGDDAETPSSVVLNKGVSWDEGIVVVERHYCGNCAEMLNVTQSAVPPQKAAGNIWQLMVSAKGASERPTSPTCPDCGMTLEELRRRGKVGCAKDYEFFDVYLTELLERMHGASRHVGLDAASTEDQVDSRKQMEHIDSLKKNLQLAIGEEDYERAANIRDELDELTALAARVSEENKDGEEDHSEPEAGPDSH